MNKLTLPIGGAAVLALVAACGGGGGGATTVLPGVVITQANAPVIAAEAVDSTDAANGQAATASPLTGVVISGNGGNFSFSDFLLNQLRGLPAMQGASFSNSLTGAVLPRTTLGCTLGGTVTVSGNITDTVSLAQWYVGDHLDASFFGCQEPGLTLDGTISLDITTAVPNGLDGLTPYTLGIAVSMRGFRADDGVDVVTGDGDVTLLIDDDDVGGGTTGIIDTTISGNALTSSVNGASYTLQNYNYNIVDNTMTGDYSFSVDATISTTKIGGTVIVTTNTPFTGVDPGDPTGGVATFTNSLDMSGARMTALANGVDVMIEVDEDGDALYEVTLMRTWAQLDAL